MNAMNASRVKMLACEHPGDCTTVHAEPRDGGRESAVHGAHPSSGASERQPKWFCTDHSSQHPDVSPTSSLRRSQNRGRDSESQLWAEEAA